MKSGLSIPPISGSLNQVINIRHCRIRTGIYLAPCMRICLVN
jgi:hypothetical protein